MPTVGSASLISDGRGTRAHSAGAVTTEGDETQPAPVSQETTAQATDDWWQSGQSWWNRGDWLWNYWWGNRWRDQPWSQTDSYSYATISSWGGQSGEPANTAPGEGSRDRGEHQQYQGNGIGAPAASFSTSTTRTTPATTTAADGTSEIDPWIAAARDLIGTARGTSSTPTTTQHLRHGLERRLGRRSRA